MEHQIRAQDGQPYRKQS